MPNDKARRRSSFFALPEFGDSGERRDSAVGRMLRRGSDALLRLTGVSLDGLVDDDESAGKEEPAPNRRGSFSRMARRSSVVLRSLLPTFDTSADEKPIAEDPRRPPPTALMDTKSFGGSVTEFQFDSDRQQSLAPATSARLLNHKDSFKSYISNKAYRQEAWKQTVGRCPLFGEKTPGELDYIANATHVLKYKAGELVYLEGDPILPKAFFYLVHSGQFCATLRSKAGGEWHAREYGPLDNFGACELLAPHNNPSGHMRVCSIRAKTNGVLWGVPKPVFDSKLRLVSKASERKSQPLLEFCQQRVRLFRCVSPDKLLQLIRGAVTIVLKPGEMLCEEGEAARELYLIKEGSVETIIAGKEDQAPFVMEAPATFGEAGLFGDDSLRVRGASVRAASTGATIVKWSVLAIETLIGFELHAQSERLYNRKMLESVQLGPRRFTLGLREPQGVDALLDRLQLKAFKPGQQIIGDGSFDELLFFVKRGRVVSRHVHTTRFDKQVTTLATLDRGDLFGEQSLLGATRINEVKQSRRRVALYAADGDEPLVCLAVSPQDLKEKDAAEFAGWIDELSNDIFTNGVLGIDAVVQNKATEEGIDVTEILNQGKGRRFDGNPVKPRRGSFLGGGGAKKSSAKQSKSSKPKPGAVKV